MTDTDPTPATEAEAPPPAAVSAAPTASDAATVAATPTLDRWLKPLSSWGMLALSLIAFGPLSALYFVFCWLVSGAIDRFVTRRERQETYERMGLPEAEIDARMLPRDRAARLIRAGFSFGAAAAFHYLA